MSSNPIIGISLGTTNACVAVITQNGPIVIPNQTGGKTIPAVVTYTQNGIYVGHSAQAHIAANPQGVFYGVKTLLAKRYSEISRKNYAFSIVSDTSRNDAVALELNGKRYTPEEVMARTIRELKLTAEKYLMQKVEKAVIAVPAHFDTAQRQALKDAGEIAGLKVVRLINEPTAAALAYSFNTNKTGKIAVYNFGENTFDFSIVDINDGVCEVLANKGDSNLGGKNIDDAIMQFLMQQIIVTTGLDLAIDLEKNAYIIALHRIRAEWEKAKKELSNYAVYDINLPYLAVKNGTPINFTYSLKRSKIEDIARPLIEKSIAPCKEALSDMRLTVNDIDEVVLLGEMTRMSLVQETVTKFFAKKPSNSLPPEEAIALGAAIQAGILSDEVQDLMLFDITQVSLGIERLGGVMTNLIDRYTTIPTNKSQVFSTAADNQSSVSIMVHQGERTMAADNKRIGEFMILGIPPVPRGIPQIETTFDIDANGILNVSAKDQKTGKELKIINNSSIALPYKVIETLTNELISKPNLS